MATGHTDVKIVIPGEGKHRPGIHATLYQLIPAFAGMTIFLAAAFA